LQASRRSSTATTSRLARIGRRVLGGLIAQSGTVVFVVSPEAVKSERCVWEVDKTLALSKRLLLAIYCHDSRSGLSRTIM
jgi:hypothetical protein